MNALVMTAASEGQSGALNGLPVVTGGTEMAPMAVFAFGNSAIEVVSGAIACGQEWLGMAPTVWRLDVAGQGGGDMEGSLGAMNSFRQQLTLFCAEVAAREGHWQRYRQGNGYGEAAGLDLWTVVDLWQRGVESGRRAGERRGTQVLQALQMMDVVAWQRLRVAIRPRVLLLTRPDDQESLEGCRQRLEAMAPEPYWVVGLAEAAEATQMVTQKAALTVAALLWGGAPVTATTETVGRKAARYYAVGAGVHAWPTAELQQALGLWGGEKGGAVQQAPLVDQGHEGQGRVVTRRWQMGHDQRSCLDR